MRRLSRSKGQFFFISLMLIIVFLSGVQAIISGFSELDLSEPYKNNEEFLYRNIKEQIMRATKERSCPELESDFIEIKDVTENYLARKGIDFSLRNLSAICNSTGPAHPILFEMNMTSGTIQIGDTFDSEGVSVTPPTPLSSTISAPPTGSTFVFGQNINFNGAAGGGTGPYTYSWNSNIDGIIGNTAIFSTNTLSLGTHTITLTVTDSVPNVATDIITIDVNPGVLATITSPNNGDLFVVGDSINFAGTASGGIAPYTYEWTSDIDGIIGNSNNFNTNTLGIGTHTIEFNVTDSTGDWNVDSIIITVNPVVSAFISSPNDGDVFTQGDSINFQATVSGGIGPYAYSWTSNISGNFGNSDNFNINTLGLGTHNISLLVTDNHGDSSFDSITITINPPVCNSCDGCNAVIALSNPGDTVTLLNNIWNHAGTCIDFGGKDGIIFDCDNWNIEGDDNLYDNGIYLSSADNNIIRNCFISKFYFGINIEDSRHNRIESSVIFNNMIDDINIDTLNNAHCDHKFQNVFGTGGGKIEIYNYSVVIQNDIFSGLILCDADNSFLNNVEVNPNFALDQVNTLRVHRTSDSLFSNLELTGLRTGMELEHGSSNNILVNITSHDNRYNGLRIYSSGSNNLTNVSSYSCGRSGITFSSSGNNRIINSEYNSNQYGIWLIGGGNYFENVNASFNSDIGLMCIQNSNKFRQMNTNNNRHGIIVDTSHANYFDRVYSKYNINHGLHVIGSHDNYINNSEFIGNGWDGIFMEWDPFSTRFSERNVFDNVTSGYNRNGYVVYRHGVERNVLNNSRIVDNTDAGVFFDNVVHGTSDDNVFYNNIFNNSGTNGNVYPRSFWDENVFNTGLMVRTNIIGGPLVGGNCYTNNTGNGFSDTCIDSDGDDICDFPYDLEDGDTNCAGSDNCDRFPLKL